MGPTTPRARPVLSPRQVKKNKRAADHQASLAAVAALRSTSSKTNGAPPSVPSDGAPTTTPASGDPPAAETGGDTDAMSVGVSSPSVDPASQHEGVAATGAPRARKRTEAGLASPPPIARTRRGDPGLSPFRPCAAAHMSHPSFCTTHTIGGPLAVSYVVKEGCDMCAAAHSPNRPRPGSPRRVRAIGGGDASPASVRLRARGAPVAATPSCCGAGSTAGDDTSTLRHQCLLLFQRPAGHRGLASWLEHRPTERTAEHRSS